LVASFDADEMQLLIGSPPFIETIGHNAASPFLESGSKGRLGVD
jgi:hypothetical protein